MFKTQINRNACSLITLFHHLVYINLESTDSRYDIYTRTRYQCLLIYNNCTRIKFKRHLATYTHPVTFALTTQRYWTKKTIYNLRLKIQSSFNSLPFIRKRKVGALLRDRGRLSVGRVHSAIYWPPETTLLLIFFKQLATLKKRYKLRYVESRKITATNRVNLEIIFTVDC